MSNKDTSFNTDIVLSWLQSRKSARFTTKTVMDKFRVPKSRVAAVLAIARIKGVLERDGTDREGYSCWIYNPA